MTRTIGFFCVTVWYILSKRLLLCFVFQLWWHRPSIFSYKHRSGQLHSICPAADASLCIHALAGQRTNQHGRQCGTHLRPTQTQPKRFLTVLLSVQCRCLQLTVQFPLDVFNSYQCPAELMSTKQLACWVYAGWYTQECCLYGREGLSWTLITHTLTARSPRYAFASDPPRPSRVDKCWTRNMWHVRTDGVIIDYGSRWFLFQTLKV